MTLQVLRECACQRSNRVLIACVYFAAFVGLGLCIASLGPALIDLAEQVDTSLTYAGMYLLTMDAVCSFFNLRKRMQVTYLLLAALDIL
jgi:hypothetical protein